MLYKLEFILVFSGMRLLVHTTGESPSAFIFTGDTNFWCATQARFYGVARNRSAADRRFVLLV